MIGYSTRQRRRRCKARHGRSIERGDAPESRSFNEAGVSSPLHSRGTAPGPAVAARSAHAALLSQPRAVYEGGLRA